MSQTDLTTQLKIMDGLADYYKHPMSVIIKGTQVTVKKTCNVNGKEYYVEFDMYKWVEWRFGTNIMDVWPNMSDNAREFVMTGITPEEWNHMLPPEDDEQMEHG